MFGAGLTLIFTDKLPKDQRTAIGRVLTLVGAVTTIPLVMTSFAKKRLDKRAEQSETQLTIVLNRQPGERILVTGSLAPLY